MAPLIARSSLLPSAASWRGRSRLARKGMIVSETRKEAAMVQSTLTGKERM